jgi:hypothetical protein
MKNLRRLLAVVLVASAIPARTLALSPEDIAKAQKVLQVVLDIRAKMKAASIQLTAPTPQTNQVGPYFLPYNSKGEITPWANKAISAQVGAAIGEKAGEEAGKAVLNQVPLGVGSLFSGAAKKKGKELGAIAAVGGPEAIKNGSDLSFATLEDYAVYLQATHATDGEFPKALATAIAIYPQLEKTYPKAIKAAYDTAAKALSGK